MSKMSYPEICKNSYNKSNLPAEQGWAIQIRRDDRSTFLAPSGSGTSCPLVWSKNSRKWTVKYKKELAAQGFACRIVPVLYSQPTLKPTTRKPKH